MESYFTFLYWVIVWVLGSLIAGSLFYHIYTFILHMNDLKGGT